MSDNMKDSLASMGLKMAFSMLAEAIKHMPPEKAGEILANTFPGNDKAKAKVQETVEKTFTLLNIKLAEIHKKAVEKHKPAAAAAPKRSARGKLIAPPKKAAKAKLTLQRKR